MSVSAISSNSYSMNASYPKYLENKKRSASYMMLASGALGTGVAALHFSKAQIAQKNPWLLATGAAISLLGVVLSAANLSSASKEIKKLQVKQQVQNTTGLESLPKTTTEQANKVDNKQERAKQAINHMAMSNPLINPTGYLVHAANPSLPSSQLDSHVVTKI